MGVLIYDLRTRVEFPILLAQAWDKGNPAKGRGKVSCEFTNRELLSFLLLYETIYLKGTESFQNIGDLEYGVKMEELASAGLQQVPLIKDLLPSTASW